MDSIAQDLKRWTSQYIQNAANWIVSTSFQIGRDSALTDSDIKYVQFSALLDSKVCDFCRHFDGMILSTDSEEYISKRWSLPRHSRCRCLEIGISRYEPDVQENFKPPTAEQMEEYSDPSSYEKWKLGIPKAGYWMDQAVKAWEDKYELSEGDSVALSFLNVMPKRIIRWISKHGRRFPIMEKTGKALNPVLRKSMTHSKMQRIKDQFDLLKSWSKGIEDESRIGFGANDPIKALLGDGTYIKLKVHSFQEHGFARELIAQRVADFFGLTKYFPTKTITSEGHLIERWIDKAATPMQLGADKNYRYNNVVNDFIRSKDGRKIGILDYILGNGDRHTGNFLVSTTDESMHIIDNESVFNSMTVRSPFTENLLRTPLNDEEVKLIKEFNSKLDKYLSINIKEISPSFHQNMEIDQYRERILRTVKKRINTLIKTREPGDDAAKRFLDANGDLRELPSSASWQRYHKRTSGWKGPG